MDRRMFIDLLLITIMGLIISLIIRKKFPNIKDDILFYSVFPTVYVIYFLAMYILKK